MANPLPNLMNCHVQPGLNASCDVLSSTPLFPQKPVVLTINQVARIIFNYGTGLRQANQVVALLELIPASSNVVIDLASALTNLAGDSAATFASIKAMLVMLLNPQQDSVNGTAASSITFGNAMANQARLFFGPLLGEHDVENGGFYLAATPSAAGRGVGVGNQNLMIVNNDAGLVAATAVVFFGSDH